MNKSHWIWMPHPGHYICADRCKFRLNTYVGGYIVSTVGEMVFDRETRKVLSRDNDAYEEVGCDRKYETMVFEAKLNDDPDWQCCPYIQASGNDVDMNGYNTRNEALKGHLEMCEKWSGI